MVALISFVMSCTFLISAFAAAGTNFSLAGWFAVAAGVCMSVHIISDGGLADGECDE